MNRQRYEKRIREDAQTWKDRLIGKRIVTSDPHIAAHEGWKNTDYAQWEPRVYFCQPPKQGFDKDVNYDVQPNSPFLRLPAEIRNHILEYVVPPQMIYQKNDLAATDKTYEFGDAVWMNTSAIIFTCKQLYAEGRALAVEKHTFEYEKFPKKTRFASTGRSEENYLWDLLNVECDMKTNVVKLAYYG